MKKSIYTELTVLIIISAIISIAISEGLYVLCTHNQWFPQITQDYSNSRKNCDYYVMELIHNIDKKVVEYEESVQVELGLPVDFVDQDYDDPEYKKRMQNWYQYVFNQPDIVIQGRVLLTDKNGVVLLDQTDETFANECEDSLIDLDSSDVEADNSNSSNDNSSNNGSNSNNNNNNSNSNNKPDSASQKKKCNIDKLVQMSLDQSKCEYLFVSNISVAGKSYHAISQQQIVPETIYSYARLRIVTIVIGMMTFFILILLGIRRKICYIKSLSNAVKEIAKGDFNTNIDVDGSDELAVVALSIDHMQHELKNQMQLQMKNEEKVREMITNISHDLKTPLTIITGYLDVIKKGQYESKEQQMEYLDKAYDRAISMDSMIKKIFQLAKQGDIRESLNLSEINLALLLRQMYMEYQPIAQKNEKNLVYQCDKLDIQVSIDVDRMMNAFGNLFMNAIKYAVRNSTIEVNVEDRDEVVFISFKNKANNVNASEIDQFFDKFYRGDKARNSKVEGNGVGLALVKEIVEWHQGKVWAEYEHEEIMIGILLKKK